MKFEYYIFRLLINTNTGSPGIIGLLAVFVPAGLGIRKGVMVFTLSFIKPPEWQKIITLLSRVWIIFAEIILVGAILFLEKKSKYFIKYGR